MLSHRYSILLAALFVALIPATASADGIFVRCAQRAIAAGLTRTLHGELDTLVVSQYRQELLNPKQRPSGTVRGRSSEPIVLQPRQWSRRVIAQTAAATPKFAASSTLGMTSEWLSWVSQPTDDYPVWASEIPVGNIDGLAALVVLPGVLIEQAGGTVEGAVLNEFLNPVMGSMRSQAIAQLASENGLKSVIGLPNTEGPFFMNVDGAYREPRSVADLLTILEAKRCGVGTSRAIVGTSPDSDIKAIIGEKTDHFSNRQGHLHQPVAIGFTTPDRLQVAVKSEIDFEYRIERTGLVEIGTTRLWNDPRRMVRIEIRGARDLSPKWSPKVRAL